MTSWNPRIEQLLAESRRLAPPLGTKSCVRDRLASSIALSALAVGSTAAAGTATGTASAKSSPWVFAKLASAVKAGCAIAPSTTAAVSTPVLVAGPIAIGIALGLSAIAPSSVEFNSSTVRANAPTARVTPSTKPLVQATRDNAIAPVPQQSTALLPTKSQPSVKPSSPSAPKYFARQSALLERARVVLRQGDAMLALRSLQDYQREFPNGTFFVEALTLESQALCQLGRVEEGRRLVERLEVVGAATGTLTQAKKLCDVGGQQ